MKPSETAGLLDSIDRNFQRLLRWAYPAALLLLLLLITDSSSTVGVFVKEQSDKPLWVLAVGLLAAGAATYLFHMAIVIQAVSLLSIGVRWELNALDPGTTPVWPFKGIASAFDKWATSTQRRWNTRDKLGGYLDYAWATCHAQFITGWLTLVFIFFFKAGFGVFGMVFAGLFVVGALVSYGHLARLRLDAPNEKE